jgi:hypothetical protein
MRTHKLFAQSVIWLAFGAALCTLPAASSLAHEGDEIVNSRAAPAAALVQLESVRAATAAFRDVAAAEAAGYVDIGLFVPHMGHHYLNTALLDGKFEATKPELLVYQDDACTGQRRLVAVEYAVPLSLATIAPAGFIGDADGWAVNNQFQLWTLHAWIWEYNTAGVFSGYNQDVP